MPRSIVLFSDTELCNIVLPELNFNFASAFWASKGVIHFPICLKTLKEDLELVALIYDGTAKLVDQAQGKWGIPQATPKQEVKVKMANPHNFIPKKSKEKFSKDQPEGSTKTKVQKLCQTCAKWMLGWVESNVTESHMITWSSHGRDSFNCSYNTLNPDTSMT